MKNILRKSAVLMVVFIFSFSFSAFASTEVNVYVNNKYVEFDVSPVIENGRALVPLRGVFEKIGAKVDWNKSLSEAVIKDDYNEIEMILGKDKVMVNGEVRTIDVPTRMINSRTFVPLRFITESLGHTVSWDSNSNSIYITTNASSEISRSIVLTVGSKDNLLALLEYNSRLFGYIGLERSVSIDGATVENTNENTASKESEAAQTPMVPEMDDSSDTNNQVDGVQEGDIIKNDGRYIYINTESGLKIIDSDPDNPKIEAEINVPENTYISEIFAAGGKLAVIGQNNYFRTMNYNKSMEADSLMMPYRYYEDRVNVLVYNIENIKKPVLEKEYLFDGNYLSGRMIEDKLYLISTKYINYGYDMYSKSDVEIPMPYYTDVLADSRYEFDYDEIKYFPNHIEARYMYTAGIDLSDKTAKPDVDVYLGGSDSIYVSKDNMYAAITDYSYDDSIEQKELYNPAYTSGTVIYKFSLNKGSIDVVSQGDVPGTIINQFSMDEHNGMFRIATTTGEMWRGTSQNNVYILDEKLNAIGKLEGLAPGEKIYSTRFAGDRIYMVTFKQVDPLYVINASDSANPVVEGMLKVPGYSTYLHIVDENHIIGFGYDTEQNSGGATVNEGLKISLFDVTDANKPIELQTETIGKAGTYSELLYNHKALMFSLNKGLMAFPITVSGANYKTEFSGAYIYNVDNDGFKLKNKISHESENSSYIGSEIRRVIYIGDYIYSFSYDEIQIYSIVTDKKVNELMIK